MKLGENSMRKENTAEQNREHMTEMQECDDESITREDITAFDNFISKNYKSFWNNETQLLHKILAHLKTLAL